MLPPTNLQDLLPAFRSALAAEGRSPKTWRVYATYLNYFIAWSSEIHARPARPEDLSTAVLRAYHEHRAALGIIANTRNLELSALMTLAHWLVEKNLLAGLPVVKRPRKEPQSRTVPTDTETFALLDACERFPDPARCALARLIIRLLMHTGVRRGELIALTLSDFDTQRRLLNVQKGKGGKQRYLPLCDELLDAYCAYRRVRLETPTQRLLLAGRVPVGTRTLTTLFADLRAQSRQRDKTYLQPHGLRHWFACNARRNGASLEALQQMLGHTSLQATQIYLQGLGEDVTHYAAYTGTAKAALARPAPRRDDQRARFHVKRASR